MPVLYAEIQIAGLRAPCSEASYGFDQGTDYVGCPNTTVHVGLLKVVLTGEVAASTVWEALMFDPYRRESGHLIFFQGEDQTFKHITFFNAACVFYKCRFDARDRDGQGSFETELRFSAATLDAQGQRIDAHSIIPWVTDAATSRRALTKPPEPYLGLPPMPTAKQSHCPPRRLRLLPRLSHLPRRRSPTALLPGPRPALRYSLPRSWPPCMRCTSSARRARAVTRLRGGAATRTGAGRSARWKVA